MDEKFVSPLVSIITIVYNNVDYIDKCIKSVSSQSYNYIEHIVIDGNSTDGTIIKIQENLEQIALFISEPDTGLYNALNKGIKCSTGDIIGILHSDDIFYSDHIIDDIVNVFNTQITDIVYGNGLYINRKNKVVRDYSSCRYNNKLLLFGWIPLHTTIFVKRDVFNNYGFYNEEYLIASDYDISLRWFLNNNISKYYLNKYLVIMRLGGKSTTLSLQKIKSKEDLIIINKHRLLGFITLIGKILQKIPQYFPIKASFSKYVQSRLSDK